MQKASATAATPRRARDARSCVMATRRAGGREPPAPRKLRDSCCAPADLWGGSDYCAGALRMWFLLADVCGVFTADASAFLWRSGGKPCRLAADPSGGGAERKERALALATACDVALSGVSGLKCFWVPGGVLGCGPRQPYLRGRNLPLGTLEKQDAPHYLPLPAPSLGQYLKLRGICAPTWCSWWRAYPALCTFC